MVLLMLIMLMTMAIGPFSRDVRDIQSAERFIFISFSFQNYLYRVKVTKGLDLQTSPVFALITLIQ